MKMNKYPMTPAIKILEEENIKFIKHIYDYQKSGAKIAASKLGVDRHLVVKTLVMYDNDYNPFIILMHADQKVSLKKLARQLRVKKIHTMDKNDAEKYTGYNTGGISPFGIKRKLPVYVEESILDLPKLYINAGRRGFLVEMNPKDLIKLLNPIPVNVSR